MNSKIIFPMFRKCGVGLISQNFIVFKSWVIPLLLAVMTGSAESGRPNFIIIIGDDIGRDDFGCYGHPSIHTPNVDQLAQDGLRFDAAFLTASSCSPSRNSILAGRYPHNTNAQHLHSPTPPGTITFPQRLKEEGYYTAAAGKWHLGSCVRAHFDRVEDPYKMDPPDPSGEQMWIPVLQERPKGRPFFMWFASLDAHRGWSAQDIDNSHPAADVVIPPYLLDAPEYREDFVQYYNEITRLDQFVGRVRAELERQGVVDNTLILFMADNGRPFPRCKNTCYDSGLQTPFIVYYPPLTDLNRGSSSGSLVSSIDIAPTLMELAGIEKAPSFQGVSFVPVLKNPAARVREKVFGEKNWHDFQGHERMVRTEKYLYVRNAFPELPLTPAGDCWTRGMYQKLIKMREAGPLPDLYQWADETRSAELLIDVQNDPYQLKNLAADPEHADILKSMRDRMDQWVVETKDSVPENPVPDFLDRKKGRRLYENMGPSEFVSKHFVPETINKD
jgi:arylsulfatase A-like enzyme